MRKKIKDIQAGDILYMVNEGTSVGYLRIEAYRAKTGLIKQGKVPDLYYIELENMLPLHVHKMQFDETSLGFIFTKLSPERYNIFSVVYEWTLSNIFVVIICYINTICSIFNYKI